MLAVDCNSRHICPNTSIDVKNLGIFFSNIQHQRSFISSARTTRRRHGRWRHAIREVIEEGVVRAASSLKYASPRVFGPRLHFGRYY